jgi:2-polyprenyl-3-methyl-5-hydroxy-6-metoxy-1,4-benzoquinol methylase
MRKNPLNLTDTKRQFDAVAIEYDFMAETFHVADFFLEHLPKGRQRALDLGCGSGCMVHELSQHFEQVIGIDLSHGLLEIAQAKRMQQNILYCQMDLYHCGLQQGFDFIISKNVFHHLSNIPDILKQVKMMLKPEGRLILTDLISERETPAQIVYYMGAVQEYVPNVLHYGWEIAQRIFRFRLSKHWLSHLASDRYLSGCTFPHEGTVIWDKPLA